MARLAAVLFVFLGATLAGSAMVVALVLGYTTGQPLIIAAAIGFVAAIPVSVIAAQKLT